jgi:glycosyltransferase involved in cell wall biosynthesis
MKISYLITLYNKPSSIADCIESINTQEGNFSKEIIVVDDGSTDNSSNLAHKKLESLGVDYKILSQKNSGPSVAVNSGIKLCTGDYISLIDADDILISKNVTSTLLDLLKSSNDIHYVRARHVNNKNFDNSKFDEKITIHEQPRITALNFYVLGTSCSLIKTEFLKKSGGCDERVFIQDYSITLRLSNHTKFIEINKVLAADNSKSDQRLSSSKFKENRDAALARMYFCLEHNLSADEMLVAVKIQTKKTFSWHRKTKGIFKAIFSKFFIRFIYCKLATKISKDKFLKFMKESIEVFEEK